MDVTTISRSKTRRELFRLYFTNPESEYYLRELERILGIPIRMVREELLRLEGEGLFRSHKKGNLTYYALDKSYPLFEEMKSIVFKTIGAKGALKHALERIRGIKAAFIYGSFAKNEERSTSDIDLSVIGDVGERELTGAVAHLEKILKREINYVLYTEGKFKRRRKEKDSFVMDLLQGKKVFIAGTENDL